MRAILKRLFQPAPPMSYAEARELAGHGDPAVRTEFAARQDARPEILYFLAGDGSPDVRRAAAANDATPPQANLLLARDADVDVRGALAEKIARLLPELSSDARVVVHIAVLGVLEALARDPAPGVRARLAEGLKDSLEAPAHVIGWLARDRDIEVAGPVLQFSPLLTDDDLFAVIANAPVAGAIRAMAQRGTLSPRVAGAIAAAVTPVSAPPTMPSGAARARQLHDAKRLDETALMEALAAGDHACVVEGLALLAGVPAASVARVRAARSAKGVTALAWKAGLSMRFAIRLQARFAGVAPGDILNARDGFGFPMTRDEMTWMLDFFRS